MIASKNSSRRWLYVPRAARVQDQLYASHTLALGPRQPSAGAASAQRILTNGDPPRYHSSMCHRHEGLPVESVILRSAAESFAHSCFIRCSFFWFDDVSFTRSFSNLSRMASTSFWSRKACSSSEATTGLIKRDSTISPLTPEEFESLRIGHPTPFPLLRHIVAEARYLRLP